MACFPRRLTCLLFAALLGVGFVAPGWAQEQFVLQVPGQPNLTSTAAFRGQQLVITDSANQTFVYERVPRLDTADGRYLGFYSRGAGQAIRWPANDAGSMLIGDANGQNWRQSRQQIRAPQPRQPLPQQQRLPQRQPEIITARRPNSNPRMTNPPFDNRQLGNRAVGGQDQQRRQNLPMQVAYTRSGDQALDVGYIGPQGDLQLYRGWRDEWQPRQFANQQALQSAGLIPGAPLQLVSRQGQEVPSAYTVNSGGRLVEIGNNGQVRPVANDLQFAPRSHFRIEPVNNGLNGFAVDAQGRLWNLDLAGGRNQLIDQNPDRFTPGVPISVVSQPASRGLQNDLFLVDRTGQLVNYTSRGGRWMGPSAVASGFPPGAPITATLQDFSGRNQIRLAGVDALGRVQTLGRTQAGWQITQVRGATISPGTPLAFTGVGPNLALSGIGPGGVWNQWGYQGGNWNQTAISRGFLGGAPIVADPFSQTAFGVDATGRLITGGYWGNEWHSHLLLPGLDYAPPLVGRTIVGTQPLPPVTVYFDNPSQEELVVQMVDQFSGRGDQFNIPPGGSVPRSVPRGAAGTLQETYLAPGPFGEWVERVETFSLPPQPGPTMVVWAKRVTYTYIDPKNISVVPDFDLKNNVSLGVFELPPGQFLENGDRFNAYAEAVARQNPGGAQYFGPPVPDPDVGVRLYRDYGTNPQTTPPVTTPRQTLPQYPPRETTPDSNLPPLPTPSPRQSPLEEQPNSQPADDSENRSVLPPLPE